MQAAAVPESEATAEATVLYQPLVVVPAFTLRHPLGALVRAVRFSRVLLSAGEPRVKPERPKVARARLEKNMSG
jgi:hypothetical protein